MTTPLALYIHIPWCIKKCPYCDFNSHVHSPLPAPGPGKPAANAELPEQAYLNALLADLDEDLRVFTQRPSLHSIFIGGGTPSLLSAGFYQQLLVAIQQRLVFSPHMEVTLEANPGTVDEANFAGFRAAGINRLSLGVQSFSNPALQQLGRIHSSDDAVRAFAKARDAGFTNINLDLMHGLPGQQLQDAVADIERALALQPEHISWYQLTIERNTEFYSRPPRLPDEPVLLSIQASGLELLRRHGYQQYEVSAFALDGFASQHNLNYWQFGDYLGIGAGAHGKLDCEGEITRRWKTRVPAAYLNSECRVAGTQVIAPQQLAVEFMMNALRLKQGFEVGLFSQRTGLPYSDIAGRVQQLVEQELMCLQGDRIAASERGWLFLNDVIAEFA
ncbi:MAG: radical SAM family heme chaperone HemW [Gammaproteobacteria bacterium]|nr:radical SAM family heme chaperone HemW [Gammaproteobacteria bacterium]